MMARLGTAVTVALHEIGKDIVTDIKSTIKTRGDYNHHSQPGDPPFYQTGRLYRSVRYTTKLITRLKRRLTVSATVQHGVWLEKGTSKMEARPFLKPALKRAGNLGAKLRSILKRTLRSKSYQSAISEVSST